MLQIVRIFLILSLLSIPASSDSLYTRNLHCEQQPSKRSKEICHALEHALEWTWTGHNIISPSFRLSFKGIRHAYCTLPITTKDIESLVEMALNSEGKSGMRPAQINNGATSLLLMLGQQAVDHFPELDKITDNGRRSSARYLKEHISLSISETSTSIFNPSHVHYILRDGCP